MAQQSRRKKVAYRTLTQAEEDQIVVFYKDNKTIDEIKGLLKIEDGRQITGVLAAKGLFKRDESATTPAPETRRLPDEPLLDAAAREREAREREARARLQPEGTQFVRTGRDAGTTMGYIPAQVAAIEYRIKRTMPDHGYVGKMVGQFDVSKLGAQFGNGKYTIEEWRTGERMAARVWEETITGHGDPRWPSQSIFGEGASAMMQPPAPPSDPAAFARVTIDALRTGHEMATPKPAPPVAPPPPSLAEKAGEKVINTALENLANPPKSGADNWLQTFLTVEAHKHELDEANRKREHDEREEDRKRDRLAEDDRRKKEREDAEDRRKKEREDADDRRKHEREDEDRRHKMEMEKLKAETDAKAIAFKAEMELKLKEIEIKAKAEAEAAKTLQAAKEEIANDRLQMAIDKQEEAQQATQEAIAANETRLDAKMALLAKENADRLTHELAIVELKKDLALKSIEVEKAKNSGEDPMIKIVDKVLSNVNDRAKEAIAAKTAQTAIEHNPGAIDKALQNPDTMKKFTEGAGVPKIDQLIKTQEFKDFLEEWCLHVSESTPPEFLFETILRQQRANAPGINEFIDFITPRRWALVKKSVWQHITAEQQEVLDGPYAEEFYEKLKAMISIVRLQILKSCVKTDLERVEVQMRNETGPAPTPTPVAAVPAATTTTTTTEPKKEEAPATPVPAAHS